MRRPYLQDGTHSGPKETCVVTIRMMLMLPVRMPLPSWLSDSSSRLVYETTNETDDEYLDEFDCGGDDDGENCHRHC